MPSMPFSINFRGSTGRLLGSVVREDFVNAGLTARSLEEPQRSVDKVGSPCNSQSSQNILAEGRTRRGGTIAIFLHYGKHRRVNA